MWTFSLVFALVFFFLFSPVSAQFFGHPTSRKKRRQINRATRETREFAICIWCDEKGRLAGNKLFPVDHTASHRPSLAVYATPRLFLLVIFRKLYVTRLCEATKNDQTNYTNNKTWIPFARWCLTEPRCGERTNKKVIFSILVARHDHDCIA